MSSTFGVLDRIARRIVNRRLDGLRRGEVTLQDHCGSETHGESADLHATVRVRDPRFFRDAVLGGTMAVGEAYVRGAWECDDLTSLIRIFTRNVATTNRLDNVLASLVNIGHRLSHAWRANTRAGSQRNIAAHYDLGNDFYRLWLDDTLAYSCGIFAKPGAMLRDASLEKFDRVCRKLDLQPTDDVVEIGTGWGGFAVHAARNHGCRVTTTTISREQFQLARQRIEAAELGDRVTLLEQDYRDLRGQFDKLVSIEMIEAVGYRHLDSYFRQCSQLLRPDGSMVIQAIVMPERGYERYVRSVDFLQRYIFPGGCLPSLGAILTSVARKTDLRLVHVEDFAPHYAETLRRWRRNFLDNIDEVRRLGHADSFIRLWEYYLCYCEAAFEERSIGLLQIQFDKPRCRRDPVRISQLAGGTTRISTGLPKRSASEDARNHTARSRGREVVHGTEA